MNKLIIERKHTRGTSFDSIHDDALSRAVKEQYPDVQLKKVFCDFFEDKQGRQYTFDTTDRGYNRRTFNCLQEGDITSIHLVIIEDELQQHHRKAVNNLIENAMI